jgi:hypothetical protein
MRKSACSTRYVYETNHEQEGGASMRHALTRHLKLGSVRNLHWVTAHFGHR